MEQVKVNLLIDNKEITTEKYEQIRDPGKLSDVVGSVAQGTAEDVDLAVKSAHEAYLHWKKTDPFQRIDLLKKAAEMLKELQPTLTPLLVREQGMLKKVTEKEVSMAVLGMKNIAELAESFFGDEEEYEDEYSKLKVEKVPYGVIAGIVPWNAPIVLTIQKMAPAIVTGNTIVIKPSPNAPLGVSVALKRMASLFPPGVINVVHGGGEVGAALTSHPLVRKISFTGGGATAEHIMKAAAEGMKSVHFELGGNDPALILDDINMDEAIPALAQQVFKRSGQVCMAIKRIYCPASIYESFVSRFAEYVDQFQIGHGLDDRATFGPVNNQAQYEYVQELIQNTQDGRGKVMELGQKVDASQWENGYYLHPTIIKDVEPTDKIVTSEQFGPVIPIVAYHSEEQVVSVANDTEYGLSSSVWSSDIERAQRMAQQMETGMTYINGHGPTLLAHRHMPFGGVKQSGIGWENGGPGLMEYVQYHSINEYKTTS